MSDHNQFIPALRFKFLTPLYDPLLRWGMREITFKRRLIQEARIAPKSRVLDLGCGTGTLTVLIKQIHSDAQVVGVDGDPTVLAIARAKAVRQNVSITFAEGMAFQLADRDHSFDRVVSSLMMHHLATADKQRALSEALRVLKPGGELLIVDFAQPDNFVAAAIATIMRRFERTADLIEGRLPEMIRAAGFQNVEIVVRFATIFGALALYRGVKPAR
ncbi:MAG: methyltransferase domain-containing protein [Chloroflexi bacterium]|nr:methyltransferase domain-containing protein [Chloroflexota bacterium]